MIYNNFIDKMIAKVSPENALKRVIARKKLEILNSGYGNHGANNLKKSSLGWNWRGGSPSDDTVGQSSITIKTLRQKCRDLFMGGGVATSALRTPTTNVIGTGLKLTSSIDYEFLGMSEEAADAWQRNTEREFTLWCKDECDMERTKNFEELQALAFLSALMSGDVAVALPMKQFPGQIYSTKVLLIESDRIDTPPKYSGDRFVRGGVKMDMNGTPQSYFVSKMHPLDLRAGNEGITFDEYPAFGGKSGRRNLFLLMKQDRPGQPRGVPFLAPVIEELKQLERYTEAELAAAVVSAMFTVFVTSQNAETPLGEAVAKNDQMSDDEDDYELASGAIISLNQGEDIKEANPSRPNPAFDGFMNSMMAQIGCTLEIPLEVLTKRFLSSYSAARAALLEAWKFFKCQRNWIANKFCQVIYEVWLEEAVAVGYIEAPGFFEDKRIKNAYCCASWYGPTQGQIDPTKEVEASILKIDNFLSTRDREVTELTGCDFEDVVRQRIREEKMLEKGGLSKSEKKEANTYEQNFDRKPDDNDKNEQD